MHYFRMHSRVPDQNGISQVYTMLEIYHSGPEPSNYVIWLSLRIIITENNICLCMDVILSCSWWTARCGDKNNLCQLWSCAQCSSAKWDNPWPTNNFLAYVVKVELAGHSYFTTNTLANQLEEMWLFTTKWVVMCQAYFCSSNEFAAGVWKCWFWYFDCNCLRNHLSLVRNMEIAPLFRVSW